MPPSSINHDILIEDDAWNTALPGHGSLISLALDKTLHRVEALDAAQDLEISITLTNDDAIRILNRDYRGKDKPTNVLSFPQIDWDNEGFEIEPFVMLGDIVISIETIIRESEEQDKRLQDHFMHMLVHSILHLCGHDHEQDTEAQTMESLEVLILEDMGIKNPYQDNQTM